MMEIQDLTVSYGSYRAVRSVSLTVDQGEIVALLGPSGSGKSTLLRAIAGLETPTSGTMSWNGEDVISVPVHRRGFGLMFQDGQLFAHRSVGGNVAYGLASRPKTERARRVAEMLELVRLGEMADRAVTSLSGGQAQRVALARALAPNPSVMLLDEPLSSLDRAMRERLASDIRTILKASGSTAIYVTHDQDEAFTVADRIAVLIDGEIARIGTPAEVWRDPQRADVAEFLGYGPLLTTDEGVRALAPDALTIGDESASGLPVEVDVRDVRVRRGYTDLVVTLEGHDARARIHRTDVDPDELMGARLSAVLDLAASPLLREEK
ncbi:ABC transporter ATP-binding protein [Bowdeniella nasicola]|nr:ABC transporter ATP-binding protein [Bowdeniella nasicola]